MKRFLTVIMLLSLQVGGFAENPVWQLGTPDGSEREFTPYYNAWEYGNAPDIQNSPAMDHLTHTFQYEITENTAISRPSVVSGLATESTQAWMKADEIVSGLTLVWNETESGNRRLDLDLVNWSNPMKAREGIEVELPGGGRKRFSLPDGAGKKGEPLKFTAVFPVKSGRNSLTVRIISMARHYRLQFDDIVLSKTDAAPDILPVILERAFNAPDGIYHPGDKAELDVQAFNLPGGTGKVNYMLEDAYGKTLKSGVIDLAGSAGKLPLPTEQRGYFKLKCDAGELKFESAFVVIEPVKAEYVYDSRFGAHALGADGYRTRNWDEYQKTRMRRAFLAGVKWIRHHSMHWFLREPEKGKFDWTNFDDRLELAEKYKMNLMLTFGGVPEWASSSNDRKMTVCGTYRYQNSPPKEWKDWSDFIGTVVSRYKGRIKWYELWNEPGFSSAFWCNGSAKDYATLLKTGYEAAKKADPDCVVVSGAPLTVDFMDAVVKENGGKLYSDVMSVHYLNSAVRDSGKFKSWKMFLNRVGAGIPIINSEEMGWLQGKGELAKASSMVKAYVREAAAGIEKTFAFDLFWTGSMFHVSAFGYDGNVLPIYAAYRTMTHRLEHAKFVADLSSSETEAYLFDRQGTPVVVVWGEKAKTVELPFGSKPVAEIDLMDTETVGKTQNGVSTVKGETLPRFFEGGELAGLTEYAAVMQAIPGTLVTGPGKRVERTFHWSNRVTGLKWNLPNRWRGTITPAGMTISVPADASAGVYEINIGLSLYGMNLSVPLLVEVSGGVPGENLVVNGDFSRNTAYWFGPADKARFKLLEGAGVNGGNAVRTKGAVHFGCAGAIKVREGEKYALIVEARGTGRFGGVYSIGDKNGKTLFPERQGINCLNGTVGPEWKIFCEEIAIPQPEAATLKFSLLANYGDKEEKEIDFNRVAIVRLTDNSTLDKAVWQGICARTSGMPRDWSGIPAMTAASADRVVGSGNIGWNGKEDLSASCRMAMDAGFLYLRFTVKDDIHDPAPAGKEEEGWRNDSIQFAIDPAMEGKDRTEILIAEDGNGKAFAYKYCNFWTPELPENLTRRGLMPDVGVQVEKSAGTVVYTAKIPLRELYPLSAKAGEFGFSWLVNDNDGRGRKFLEWSSGIGGEKKFSRFGLVRVK